MGDISAEPSMEDILSSIKRIIAEEGESAVSNRARRPARAAVPLSDRNAFGHDEILELSDPVKSVDDEAPRAEHIRTEQPRVEQARIEQPRPVAPAPVAAAPAPADPIVSPRAEEASRGALDALSRMVVKPEVQGSDTLEGLVREMLRPMLRDWLDNNLPAMVETMVSREIARITSSR